MKTKIILSGMEFYAYHGCFPEEKKIGTRFKVDVVLYANLESAAQQDDLKQTINYQSVYQDIAKIMKTPVNILETLGYKIAQTLRQNYSLIEKIEVKVYKLNPALGGKVAWVATEIVC